MWYARTSLRFRRGARTVARATLGGLLASGAGCGADGPAAAGDTPPENFTDAPYGALEPRRLAARTLRAGTGAVRLRMVRFTIEGDSVVSELTVDAGRARLTIDHRGDRFGVPELADAALTDVTLARVESSDRPPVPVDPGAASLPAGTYVLLGIACDQNGCGRQEF